MSSSTTSSPQAPTPSTTPTPNESTSPTPSTSSQPPILASDPSQPPPSLVQGLQTIRPADFTNIHQRPCARESLLFGMGSGFALGGLRFILGARQHLAMSWAVGAFCVGSAGAFAVCKERRRLEKEAMEMARKVMEKKKREKMEEVKAERERRRVKEEERRRKEGWWGWVGK